jgi:crossover junction endodeoxyribonuclease RuvC
MSSQPVVMGADPGLTGGLAFLDLEGKLVAVYDMPTVEREIGWKAIELLLTTQHSLRHAYVEHVTGGQQRPNGAFNFGMGFGVLKTVISMCNVPMTLVHPAKWKKAMGLSGDKANSRAKAMMQWPNMAQNFQRVKDDGRAEAALVALYGLSTRT